MTARRLSWNWHVFAACWAVYTLFWTPYIVREHFPALTLAEQGTLNVERYLGWSDDIFRGPHGGAYINNNPGASLTGAIPLVLLRPLLLRVDEWNRKRARPDIVTSDGGVFRRSVEEGRAVYFLLVAFLTVALVMAPATAGTAAYLCSRARQAGLSPATAAAAAVLYGLGTPILFRTGGLNHNLLAGDAGFTALLLLWDPNSRPVSTARAVGAGLLAGYAFLCDYSGVIVIAVAGLYIWLRSAGSRLHTGAAYLAGLFPAVAGMAVYQAWAFGSFYRPSQHYMTPTAPTSMGYRGFSWPSPALAWANFFDPRFGLFVYCPLLLLAFLAPFVAGKRDPIPRRETWILLIYFGLFVLFCAANQYSWLQPSTGFRYLVPIVPGLALLAMQAARVFPMAFRWILAVAALGQSLIVAAAHQNDLRISLGSLYRRRFALLWMTHLRDAGIAEQWVDAASAFLVLLALAVSVWFCVRLWQHRVWS